MLKFNGFIRSYLDIQLIGASVSLKEVIQWPFQAVVHVVKLSAGLIGVLPL